MSLKKKKSDELVIANVDYNQVSLNQSSFSFIVMRCKSQIESHKAQFLNNTATGPTWRATTPEI